MPGRIFGEIGGHPPGSTFSSRAELTKAGVHKPSQKGIAGGEHEGAESIVVSGGYADDEDLGDTIIYTGQGGRDSETGKLVADQELTRGNMALTVNQARGLPVRVVRGSKGDPKHSPREGYRYDGLYQVVDHWFEDGADGFQIVRFRLERSKAPPGPADAQGPANRRLVTTLRIVRDTALSRKVKELNKFTCQVCGVRLMTPGGPYAEGAHIRALGYPHNGPDDLSNILCLCPNHHILLDLGAIWINEDFTVGPYDLPLRTVADHAIDPAHCAYHKSRQAGGGT